MKISYTLAIEDTLTEQFMKEVSGYDTEHSIVSLGFNSKYKNHLAILASRSEKEISITIDEYPNSTSLELLTTTHLVGTKGNYIVKYVKQWRK